MTAYITEAEARRLGITLPATKKRTTRKTAGGPRHTRCTSCGAEFRSSAAEDDHVAPGHSRFELVL